MTTDIPVIDNPDSKRFEVHVDGQIARVEYINATNKIVLTHTEVPINLEGRGIAKYLIKGTLDILRTRSIDVIPLCPFVKSFIRRNPEYADLVPAEYPL
ncbi:MAG: N-acetyltransferase [Rhodothermales bacterium]|nr:N-acetyltransferase [Rhodothermales bacterium]